MPSYSRPRRFPRPHALEWSGNGSWNEQQQHFQINGGEADGRRHDNDYTVSDEPHRLLIEKGGHYYVTYFVFSVSM